MNISNIQQKHKTLFGKNNTIIVRSPGRINLIGEHIDYNDGFVFPAAIDKAIWFSASGNNKELFRFFSIDFDEYFELPVTELSISKVAWANYLLGVAAQFKKKGYSLSGVDIVFGGDIPVGAGLSSSAAVENGFALVLNKLFNFRESKIEMVKMAQKAEHEYAGVMCGIMDQFAIMFGKKQQAIKLDCRSLDFEYANIDLAGYQIVLCDTKVKHSLASSAYNQRREECESGVNLLKQYKTGIAALRDIDPDLLNEHKTEMDKVVYRRCKYVVEENLRVMEAFKALNQGNIIKLGALMNETHQGLRDDFEVSCKELDILFDFAKNFDGVIGSRMMGGGFGGCTINIVENDKAEAFNNEITKHYKQTTGNTPSIYEVKIMEGTNAFAH
jgi:galactokinase